MMIIETNSATGSEIIQGQIILLSKGEGLSHQKAKEQLLKRS
jgi:hypothetical protein